jgi:hypothetical protein
MRPVPAPIRAIGASVRAFAAASIALVTVAVVCPDAVSAQSGGYETALQANTGTLIAYGNAGDVNTGQTMMAHTSPSIVALPDAAYEIALQANNGTLVVYGPAGDVNTGQAMMAGTSPSIAAATNGTFEVAFQGYNGYLYTYLSSAGSVCLGQAMMAGTSPSIAALPGGGYEIALQASTGILVVYGSTGNVYTGQRMMAGTSPSIAAMTNGGYEVAFQANNGNLYAYTPSAGSVSLDQAMMGGTSPSIAALPGGGYEMAFQASTGELTARGSAGNVSAGQRMLARTSPSIATSPSSGYEVAFQANNGDLYYYSPSFGFSNLGQGMIGGTSPALAALVGTAAKGDLQPPSSLAALSSFDSPDPALVSMGGAIARVYTTDALGMHIPEYSLNINTGVHGNVTDALTRLPNWGNGYTWAPTVRYVNGEYLMLFSASVSGRANCIGAATSSNGTSFTPVDSVEWCNSNGAVGWFDPYLFDNGSLWVLWSEQWAPGGGSRILTQKMNVSGSSISRSGPEYTLVNYSDISRQNPNPGTNSFVENPAMVADPSGADDLIVSLGTWNGLHNYDMIELACLSINGDCVPSYAREILGSGSMNNPGGASLLYDNSPVGNYMVFTVGAGPRVDEGGFTSELAYPYSMSPSISTFPPGLVRPAEVASAIPLISNPYHWSCRTTTYCNSTIEVGAP